MLGVIKMEKQIQSLVLRVSRPIKMYEVGFQCFTLWRLCVDLIGWATRFYLLTRRCTRESTLSYFSCDFLLKRVHTYVWLLNGHPGAWACLAEPRGIQARHTPLIYMNNNRLKIFHYYEIQSTGRVKVERVRSQMYFVIHFDEVAKQLKHW